MDFSYFTAAPQPYQMFGVQNGQANGHTPSFDDYPAISSVCSKTTYLETFLIYEQEQYDAAFAAFQQNFHYDPSTFMPQPKVHSQSQSPTKPDRQDSILSLPEIDTTNLHPAASDMSPDDAMNGNGNGRSSSDEKDTMTPQQSRRKAQNRAA